MRTIIEGLDELIAYHEHWLDDSRTSVREFAKEQIDIVKEMIHKIDYYKDMAYKNKLTGDEVK